MAVLIDKVNEYLRAGEFNQTAINQIDAMLRGANDFRDR
jgi:hypothetical protein